MITKLSLLEKIRGGDRSVAKPPLVAYRILTPSFSKKFQKFTSRAFQLNPGAMASVDTAEIEIDERSFASDHGRGRSVVSPKLTA
jgi:hypothetical protein